jgi:hypothetical protein
MVMPNSAATSWSFAGTVAVAVTVADGGATAPGGAAEGERLAAGSPRTGIAGEREQAAALMQAAAIQIRMVR